MDSSSCKCRTFRARSMAAGHSSVVSRGWSTPEPTVADNPFLTLTRILGGVVLMQGRLGHQVLGQMLLTGSHEVTIAGASLVIAATAREKNAVGQAVVRTLAPAAAIYALTYRDEKRLNAIQREIDRRRRELEEAQRRLELGAAQLRSMHAKVS